MGRPPVASTSISHRAEDDQRRQIGFLTAHSDSHIHPNGTFEFSPREAGGNDYQGSLG